MHLRMPAFPSPPLPTPPPPPPLPLLHTVVSFFTSSSSLLPRPPSFCPFLVLSSSSCPFHACLIVPFPLLLLLVLLQFTSLAIRLSHTSRVSCSSPTSLNSPQSHPPLQHLSCGCCISLQSCLRRACAR